MSEPEGSASPAANGWQHALDELEQSLRQAVRAISSLRDNLADPGGAPPPTAPPSAADWPEPAPSVPVGDPEHRARSTFERLWERIELERRERAEGPPVVEEPVRRGVDLLPQQYLMTVEDREGKVDLIPLHRALLGLVPMENIALLSFANGVPVISLRVVGGLDLERLGSAVSGAMDRLCEVIQQDNGRLYLRLKAREEDPR